MILGLEEVGCRRRGVGGGGGAMGCFPTGGIIFLSVGTRMMSSMRGRGIGKEMR